ncbi:hypothetical protein D9M71_204670 [compost metagenome]
MGPLAGVKIIELAGIGPGPMAAAHFYDVYACADDQLISIGPIEGRFHADLLRHLQIEPSEIGEQNDPRNWPAARVLFAKAFAQKTRRNGVSCSRAPMCALPRFCRLPRRRNIRTSRPEGLL